MKLTVLHRYAELLKNLRYASFSVNDSSGNVPSLGQKMFESSLIYPRRFKLRLMPPEVLFQERRSEYTYSIASSPKGHVRGNGSSSWFIWRPAGLYRINLLFDPYMAFALSLGKLRQTLPSPYICLKQCCLFFPTFARGLEWLSTIIAPVPLKP